MQQQQQPGAAVSLQLPQARQAPPPHPRPLPRRESAALPTGEALVGTVVWAKASWLPTGPARWPVVVTALRGPTAQVRFCWKANLGVMSRSSLGVFAADDPLPSVATDQQESMGRAMEEACARMAGTWVEEEEEAAAPITASAVAPPAPSEACEACAGKHRPHTCGWQKQPRRSQESNARVYTGLSDGAEQLPPGWTEEQRVTATGRKYKAYHGPQGANAASRVQAWRMHGGASPVVSPPAQQAPSTVEEQEARQRYHSCWVECNACGKWRLLKSVRASMLPRGRWRCSDSPDPQYNGCDVPEAAEATEDDAGRTVAEAAGWKLHLTGKVGESTSHGYTGVRFEQRDGQQNPWEAVGPNGSWLGYFGTAVEAAICVAKAAHDADKSFVVQCDGCKKWRVLRGVAEEDLPKIWYCSDNPDPAHQSCDVPEHPEALEESDERLPEGWAVRWQTNANTGGRYRKYMGPGGQQTQTIVDAWRRSSCWVQEAMSLRNLTLTLTLTLT